MYANSLKRSQYCAKFSPLRNLRSFGECLTIIVKMVFVTYFDKVILYQAPLVLSANTCFK